MSNRIGLFVLPIALLFFFGCENDSVGTDRNMMLAAHYSLEKSDSIIEDAINYRLANSQMLMQNNPELMKPHYDELLRIMRFAQDFIQSYSKPGVDFYDSKQLTEDYNATVSNIAMHIPEDAGQEVLYHEIPLQEIEDQIVEQNWLLRSLYVNSIHRIYCAAVGAHNHTARDKIKAQREARAAVEEADTSSTE